MEKLDVLPVRVFARVRPFLDREEGSESDPVVLWRGREVRRGELLEFKNKLGERDVVEEHGPLERVFNSETTTEEVYDAAVARLVAEAAVGHDGCVLLMGQSRTGKTYSLLGEHYAGHVLRSGRTANPAPEFRGQQAFVPRAATLEKGKRWTDAVDASRSQRMGASVTKEDRERSGLPDAGSGLFFRAVKDLKEGRLAGGKPAGLSLSVVGVFDEQLFDLLTMQGLTAKAEKAARTAARATGSKKTDRPPPSLLRDELRGDLAGSSLRRVPHAEVDKMLGRDNAEVVVRSWRVQNLRAFGIEELSDASRLVRVALANAAAVRPYARPAVGAAARRRAQTHRGGAVMHMIYILRVEDGGELMFADLHGSDSLARTDALSLGERSAHLRIAGSSNRGLLAVGKVLAALSRRHPAPRRAPPPRPEVLEAAALASKTPPKPLEASRTRWKSPRTVWEDADLVPPSPAPQTPLSPLHRVPAAIQSESKRASSPHQSHRRRVLVPYRESKLACVLSAPLGGDCRTVVLGHLAPTLSSQEETGNTLRLCSLARRAWNVGRARPPIAELLSLGTEGPVSPVEADDEDESFADFVSGGGGGGGGAPTPKTKSVDQNRLREMATMAAMAASNSHGAGSRHTVEGTHIVWGSPI